MSGGPGFGTIPDIIMGKDPKDALRDNILGVTAVLTGANLAQGLGGAAGGANAMPGDVAGLPPNPFAPQPGIMGQLNTAGEYLKPIGQAANTASQVGGLLGNRQQQMPAPTPMPMGGGAGSQTLGMLASQADQNSQQQFLAAEQMRRQRRAGLLGGM